MKYFVNDNGAVTFYATEQEAIDAAQQLLEQCRLRAQQYGEWDDDVEGIFYGQILGESRETVSGVTGDYELRRFSDDNAAPAPSPCRGSRKPRRREERANESQNLHQNSRDSCNPR